MRCIVIESYAVKKEKNIIESYYDADFNLHEISAPKEKMTIEFETPYLYETDISTLISIFSGGKTSLEYYDTHTQEYITANFYMPQKLEPKLHRVRGTTIIYKPLKISINGE